MRSPSSTSSLLLLPPVCFPSPHLYAQRYTKHTQELTVKKPIEKMSPASSFHNNNNRNNRPSSSQNNHHQTFVNMKSYQHITIEQTDAFLEPNTGRTNRYDYDIFGLTLAETLERLRVAMICSTSWLLFVLLMTWWKRIAQLHHLMLSILLAGVDAILAWHVICQKLDERASTSDGDLSIPSSLLGNMSQERKDQFLVVLRCMNALGYRYGLDHPVGKVAVMIFCAFCCWTIGGAWEIIVGISFLLEALVLLYCWLCYPELRRVFHVDNDTHTTLAGGAKSASWETQSWSHFGGNSNQGEQASLLARSESTPIAYL